VERIRTWNEQHVTVMLQSDANLKIGAWLVHWKELLRCVTQEDSQEE
jgi:hypothetical protein